MVMETSGILRVSTLILSLVVLAASIKWRNCMGNDSTSRAITVNQFDAPSLISFPGQIKFSLNMTFKHEITNGFVDIHIIRYFLGFPISLPCKTGTIIGTCTGRDICSLLDMSVNYSAEHPDYYGYKFQNIMKASTNHTLKCPIKPESIVIKDQVFEFGEIASYLHLLADGNYTVRMIVKANKTEPSPVLGCIEVNVTIGGQYSSQSAFG